MLTLISGCRLLTESGILPRGDLLIGGGRIRKIGRRLPAGRARVIRAGGLLAAPGLIDTQINGGFGVSFDNASPDEVFDVGRRLLAHGVTAYLPTLVSLPLDHTLRAIKNLVAAAGRTGGARIVGIHLEGPFLSPERRGAHRTSHLRRPTLREFRRYLGASRGLLRMMTLAPELPGALGVIREGRRRGVIMSAGHSMATAGEVERAVKKGVRHVTHVFNAMAPLHHRDESILNAALLTDSLSCGFIYDRQHLSVGTARMVMKLKPRGALVLVSDTTFALDAPDGEIRAHGERFVVRKGEVRVRSTGRLAGSARSILHGVRYLMEDTGIPVEEAVYLASGAPARLLGLEGRKGVLRAGADADVVLFDRKMRVKAAFVEGEQLHGNHH